MQFLKEWGSKCKDFEKDWGLQAGALKTEGVACDFAKDWAQNAILKRGHASEKVLKAKDKQKAILKNSGV